LKSIIYHRIQADNTQADLSVSGLWSGEIFNANE
jgi:radical SAM superfamily enzyme